MKEGLTQGKQEAEEGDMVRGILEVDGHVERHDEEQDRKKPDKKGKSHRSGGNYLGPPFPTPGSTIASHPHCPLQNRALPYPIELSPSPQPE